MPALTAANDLVRARNVTASEVGALLDKHPYTNPTKIYDRLTNPIMDTHIQSDAMAIGVFLEPHVARYASRTLGLKLRAATRTVEYPGAVNLCATPDYLVLNKRMLVEIKVSSIMYGWTENTLHPHYEWQARAQLACTDRDVCIVCAMVGSTFYHVPVVRDFKKEGRMLAAVETFWFENIMAGVRPVHDPSTRIKSATATKG